jgi:hypothetical protein
MFRQKENIEMHQFGQAQSVDLGNGNYSLAETFLIIYFGN